MVQAEHCEGYGAVPGMSRRKMVGEGEQKVDEKRVVSYIVIRTLLLLFFHDELEMAVVDGMVISGEVRSTAFLLSCMERCFDELYLFIVMTTMCFCFH